MASKKKPRQFHNEIKDLINAGYTNPEIADELQFTRTQIASYAQRHFKTNPNYLKKITKHKHLRKKVMKYFLNHTAKQCQDKFNLTPSEFKSLMTTGYRVKEFKHLRKDTRLKTDWSTKELKFLLKYSGIISQKDIAETTGRGKSRIVIKEKLQSLNLCSKNINGLTLTKFIALFGKKPKYCIETSAGSPSGFTNSNWRIVPWLHIDEMLKEKYIDQIDSIKIYVETMALFQKWIHGKNYWQSLTKIPKI
jgi:biotin operon repressor